MWGQFFYNVSYCVSEVTGMQMSSKNSFITVLGYSNSKPIIMNLNRNDGSIAKFVTIEPVVTPVSTPTYITYNAVYFEEMEVADSNPYFYVSFTINGAMQYLKINANSMAIIWNF